VQWDDLGGNESLVMDGMHTVLGNKQKWAQSVLGMKQNWSTSNDEVVLRNSAQCLPLVCYNRILSTSDIDVKSVLPKIEWILQKLVDQFLNRKDPFFNESPSHVATPSEHRSNVLAKVESTSISRHGEASLAKVSAGGQGMGVVDISGQAGNIPRASPISVSGVRQRSCLAEPAIKTVTATLPYHAHEGHVTVPVSGSTSETLTYNAPKRLFQDKDDIL